MVPWRTFSNYRRPGRRQAKDTGNALLNQTVVSVGAGGNEGKAIGRIANYVNPAGTQVLVSIVSTKQFGGPQAAA